jgi:hypothetical protein
LLLQAQGKLAEAEPLLREALEGSRRTLGDAHAKTLSSMAVLGLNLLQLERNADAEPLLRECYEGRKKILEEGHWLIGNTQSMLGEAIAGQQRFAEAEPLLVEGYEKMNPPESSMNRKTEALQRVIELYTAWHVAEPGKDYEAKAAKWRLKLSESERDDAIENQDSKEDD